MYKRILVPIDGSECSTKGLLEAIKLAKSSMPAALRLVHVVNEFVMPGAGFGAFAYTGQLVESLRDSGAATLKAAEATALKHALKPETVLLERFGGRAADSIVDQAKQWPADLIVMGTHGRHGLSRLVMGSDAELVLRAAPVPVLMVRGAGVE